MTLAAIFLVGALGAVLDEPAEAQEGETLQHFRNWSVGDFWRYEKHDSGASNTDTKGEITYRVQSAERVTNSRFWDPEDGHHQDWKSHQVFRVKVWSNQTANGPYGATLINTEQERYLRTKDLGLAQSHQVDIFTFPDAPEHSGGNERYREYFPPELEMVYPFAVGDAWRIATQMKAHNPHRGQCGGEGMPPCNTTNHKVFTFSVVGTDTLNIELNGKTRDVFTYRILRVDELGIEDADYPDLKTYQVWWWSPEVCNNVKKEEYSSKRVLQRTWTLTEYNCQGRASPDPSYSSYDFQNLSSTRIHGKLAIPERMALFQDMLENRGQGETIGGNLIQLGEDLPAPGALLLVGTLLGLVAAARRRR